MHACILVELSEIGQGWLSTNEWSQPQMVCLFTDEDVTSCTFVRNQHNDVEAACEVRADEVATSLASAREGGDLLESEQCCKVIADSSKTQVREVTVGIAQCGTITQGHDNPSNETTMTQGHKNLMNNRLEGVDEGTTAQCHNEMVQSSEIKDSAACNATSQGDVEAPVSIDVCADGSFGLSFDPMATNRGPHHSYTGMLVQGTTIEAGPYGVDSKASGVYTTTPGTAVEGKVVWLQSERDTTDQPCDLSCDLSCDQSSEGTSPSKDGCGTICEGGGLCPDSGLWADQSPTDMPHENALEKDPCIIDVLGDQQTTPDTTAAISAQPSGVVLVPIPTQQVPISVPILASEVKAVSIPTQPSVAEPSETEPSPIQTQASEAQSVPIPEQPLEGEPVPISTQHTEAQSVPIPVQPLEVEPVPISTQHTEAQSVPIPVQPLEVEPVPISTQHTEAQSVPIPEQPLEGEPVPISTQHTEAQSVPISVQPLEVEPIPLSTQEHVPMATLESLQSSKALVGLGLKTNESGNMNSETSVENFEQVTEHVMDHVTDQVTSIKTGASSDSDYVPTSSDEGSSRGSSATPEPSSALKEKGTSKGTLEASHSERDLQKSPVMTLENSQSPHKGPVSKQMSMVSMPKRLSFSSKRLMKTLAAIGKRHTQMDEDLQQQTVELNKRVASVEWDPSCLLEELYADHHRVPVAQLALTGETARHFGYMEKLPVNQLKPTMTKKWKRRYFRIMEGNIYYYEHRTDEKALNFFRLENCKLQSDPKKLQAKVTACDGSFLVMRVTDENDLAVLCRTIELESTHPTICAPLAPQTTLDNTVVIIDIGASSVRAGFAGKNILPQLFFPAVCCLNHTTSEVFACGHEALLPDNRATSELIYPRRATLRMDKRDTNLPAIAYIVRYVLTQLNVEPGNTHLVMTLPLTTTDKDKHSLAEMLFETVGVLALCFQDQALLSLYSYNTTSGIVVDIGDRIDIVPVQDGFIVESGVFHMPFGGNAITEHLSKLITTKGVRYFSETEAYITRLIKESMCYVSQNYAEDVERCDTNVVDYTRALDVDRFHLPDHRKVIALDSALFKAPEGLLNPNMWGKDVRGLHQLVWDSVQACSIDQRKEMLRSIYLSGGTSRLPGLKERLEGELRLLAPSSTPVQLHVSEHSNHAAFMGGCVLATLNSFSNSNVLVTREEWNNVGAEAFKKSR